jgi:spore maturation protein CgeB
MQSSGRILISGSQRFPLVKAVSGLASHADVFDDEAIYNQQLALLKTKVTKRVFFKTFSVFLQKEFYRVALEKKPDLILVLKGWFFNPYLLMAIKNALPDTVFACFNTDNPFNVKHFGSSNEWIRRSIYLYDVYFIWGRFLMEQLKQAGAQRVEYLPFGFDADTHHPVALEGPEYDKYKNELVFIGNWDEEREYWLKELVEFDLAVWGESYWKSRCKESRLRKKWRKRPLYGEEMCKVFSASGISLNILRQQNKGCHNMRTFEAPACGTFVLAERSPESCEFFAEDKEAVYFSTLQELREKAAYYITHDAERRQIARAGYERCISSGYTYLCRAKKILDVCSELWR